MSGLKLLLCKKDSERARPMVLAKAIWAFLRCRSWPGALLQRRGDTTRRTHCGKGLSPPSERQRAIYSSLVGCL